MTHTHASPTDTRRPLFTVLRGRPTPAQTAALATIVADLHGRHRHTAPRPHDRGMWGVPREHLARPRDFNPAGFRVTGRAFHR
ncbi:acyl-CoA carboxylase subunit epsilon [Corynebacterium bovis]|uniref:Acyl-CoA carboxylase subunit epsilon n=1 Tax=Corynebacterium bovis TaxID=36808 RepID=A0A3R8VU82_9CORY|nr:acyl-CoA carboxylase subunit epsilon [Corynebacterium bovis]MDH2455548.1 acyl-CoA carboxylase subunit epsilon [Corynebacterium bovis]MDK8511387.1 acyl-CoA carboxylase subunit epsilon [Corynebacterium bovis]MDN8580139.1 acyl-CoA carboxylase subunit epsilon [Corynebacterium bovis]RRO86874.1 acyl-CoA carboxylase subunit epsilon [Corynebacterium bovis]RRO87560.1 acyl-CoA carboxylase subunit epsilon [Corynebacterium bovis]